MKNKLKKFKMKKIHFIGVLPSFKSKKGKVLKYGFLFVIPMCLAIVGAYFGIQEQIKSKSVDNNKVIVNVGKVNRRVYLVSQSDDLTIPLTVSVVKKATLYEDILDVFSLLKSGSYLETNYLKGLIPKETKVISFEVDDKLLTLNLSKEFLNYDHNNETQMIEALTMSMLQFDEVEKLRIEVEGQVLSKLPVSSYKLPMNLTYDLGVNNIITSPKDMVGKEKVTVFYQKTVSEDKKYLVPVNLYASKGESENITYVNAINQSLPTTYNLEKIDTYSQISRLQEQSEEFVLSVNSSALVDEVTVNKDLYDLVVLSLDLMNMDLEVNFTIEGETLAVDGLIQDEDVAVNDIIYNSVQL